MPRNLVVHFPDGTRWAIPVAHIAEHWAQEYHKDSREEFPTIEAAREYVKAYFKREHNVMDWAFGNMDWSDVKRVAVKKWSPVQPTDYSHWWNSEAESYIEGKDEETE